MLRGPDHIAILAGSLFRIVKASSRKFRENQINSFHGANRAAAFES